jgi:RNA polymerase sigma-70 factor, ECF subfamily
MAGRIMETTSSTLLERVRDPADHAAWERFVSIYGPLLACWASKLKLPQREATDLVQDVLLLLVRVLPRFEYRREGGFRNWLKTVAHNQWRTTARRRQLPFISSAEIDIPVPDEAEQFWEKEYHQRLVEQLLNNIRAEFEPTTWQAFDNYVVQGQDAELVARQLNLSRASVYLAKSRILKRLREELRALDG